MKENDSYLEFAKDIALYAGKVMLENYEENKKIVFKDDNCCNKY